MSIEHKNIFENTTSIIELKGGILNKMEEFTDENKIEGESLNLWNYRERKELIGKFIKIQKGTYGDMAVLEVGEEEVIIPTLSALKILIQEENIGKNVKLVYLGEKKGVSGRLYGTFDIFVK